MRETDPTGYAQGLVADTGHANGNADTDPDEDSNPNPTRVRIPDPDPHTITITDSHGYENGDHHGDSDSATYVHASLCRTCRCRDTCQVARLVAARLRPHPEPDPVHQLPGR